MTVAFTPVVAPFDFQDIVPYLNEILAAQRERELAAKPASTDFRVPLAGGEDIQGKAFFADLQEWIEETALYYIDHMQADSSGLYDGIDCDVVTGNDIPNYTLASWRAVAGLPSDGWRRAQTWVPDPVAPDYNVDPVFLAGGRMEAGDIRGPWLLDDLQKALTALKWTRATSFPILVKNSATVGSVVEERRLARKRNEPCAVSRAFAIAIWDAKAGLADWTQSIGSFPSAYAFFYTVTGDWNILRGRSSHEATLIWDEIPHSSDFYFCAAGPPFMVPPTVVAEERFFDGDGLGITDGKLKYEQTFAEDTVATRLSDVYGDIDESPAEAFPWDCSDDDRVQIGWHLIRPQFVFKWVFTTSD